MIKVEVIGMIDNSVNNPLLTSTKEVGNYDFIVEDGETYLVCNTVTGDDSYKEDIKFPKGTYLNGYNVKAWEGQKLVVDEKHIAYTDGKTYADLKSTVNFLTVDANGKLTNASAEPTSGVYFKVTDKCKLTENAIKVKVMVASAKGE